MCFLLQDLETLSHKEQLTTQTTHHLLSPNESLFKILGVCSVISLWLVVLLCPCCVDVGRYPDTSTLVSVQNFQVVARDLHLLLQAREGAGELGRPFSARDRIQP